MTEHDRDPTGSAAPQGANASAAAPPRCERRLARWAATLSLLPIPLWFAIAAALAPAPAWRAEYRSSTDASAAPHVVAERALQRYWDRSNPHVPGGFDPRAFTARWQTCLFLDTARELPIMLVAEGLARFSLDGVERLRTDGKGRVTRGEVLALGAGMHHLSVELSTRRSPSIALLASFDGEAPKPIASGSPVSGVELSPPASQDGSACPAR